MGNGNHLGQWKKGLEADLVHGHTCASHLISAIGGHAMFFQHVGKHCIGLHARLETSRVRAQKAQMPMGVDMVVDSYVMRPHIVTEWAIAATNIVHLPTIDGRMFVGVTRPTISRQYSSPVRQLEYRPDSLTMAKASQVIRMSRVPGTLLGFGKGTCMD